MKIFHCDTDDLENPLRGGQPVRTFQINSRLAARHEIEVVTATYKNSRRHTRRENVNYSSLGFGIPGLGLSHHLSFLAALGPKLRRTPHDLVVEEFTPPVGFCLLPMWTVKPVISVVQWFFFKAWEARYKLPFERVMRGIPARFRYRNFIVQTQRMGEYFKDLVPEASIYKVPCGIDAEVLLRQTNPGSYAMFLGRLDARQKGLDLLLDIWQEMFRAGIEVPLRVVGSGPDRPWLEERIRNGGMERFITLVGRVEGDEKFQLLKNCRFLVMPSREETFGLAALEAMAVSKPVVAFDIDHLNELVRPKWGILIRAGDLGGFAREVIGLWQHPERGGELGENGYSSAQSYTWDRLALLQESIYLDIALAGGA